MIRLGRVIMTEIYPLPVSELILDVLEQIEETPEA